VGGAGDLGGLVAGDVMVQAAMAAAHRHLSSRSTLERMGRRIGDAIQVIVTEVEPAIRNTEPMLRAGRSLSIGFDRTTCGWPSAWHQRRRARGDSRMFVAHRPL
jgi:hypothetical protein